jgi:predicted RNase H-like HicB family nuclease
MMNVMEDMDVDKRHDDDRPDLSWEDAVAEFEGGEPVELVRPPRKVTIVYRYTDGQFYASSPDLTGFEVSGASLHETRQLAKQDLAGYLDAAIELVERIPRPNPTTRGARSRSRVTRGGSFVLSAGTAGRKAAVFASQRRFKAS